jgi:hypothetical protein
MKLWIMALKSTRAPHQSIQMESPKKNIFFFGYILGRVV